MRANADLTIERDNALISLAALGHNSNDSSCSCRPCAIRMGDKARVKAEELQVAYSTLKGDVRGFIKQIQQAESRAKDYRDALKTPCACEAVAHRHLFECHQQKALSIYPTLSESSKPKDNAAIELAYRQRFLGELWTTLTDPPPTNYHKLVALIQDASTSALSAALPATSTVQKPEPVTECCRHPSDAHRTSGCMGDFVHCSCRLSLRRDGLRIEPAPKMGEEPKP